MRIVVMSKPEQQSISRYFQKKPVLYIGGLGIVFGPTAGIFLSQLLYWHGKGSKPGWIYKSANEFMMETGLTRDMQETAIKKLELNGVLEVKLAGIPATKHFKLNLVALHNLLPSLKKTYKLSYPNPLITYVETTESITKITHETTTKNTHAKLDRNNYFEKRQDLSDHKSIRSP